MYTLPSPLQSTRPVADFAAAYGAEVARACKGKIETPYDPRSFVLFPPMGVAVTDFAAFWGAVSALLPETWQLQIDGDHAFVAPR